MKEVWARIAKRLEDARVSQAKYYDQKREEKYFDKNDKVMISTKNLTLAVSKKGLGPKFLGPLTVLEAVGTNAYRLKLPPKWRIHDVVNVADLEVWHEPLDAGETDASDVDLPEEVSTLPSYDVEAVVSYRWSKAKGLQYLVRWEGDWPPDQKETWEPESHLLEARETVATYRESQGLDATKNSNVSKKLGTSFRRRRR